MAKRIIDKRNGIRVFFKCVSCMYIVWGIFGVHGSERPVACCMYAERILIALIPG